MILTGLAILNALAYCGVTGNWHALAPCACAGFCLGIDYVAWQRRKK